MKKRLTVLLILALLVSCNREKKEEEMEVDTTPLVKYEVVSESYMNESIRLSGDIVVSNSVDIFPDVPGKIDSLKVSEGDYVTKGSVVAYIDRNKPGMSFALSPVEAPISGTITAVLSSKGAMAAPSMPLFKVGTLDNLELETHISERDINRVTKGQKAILTTVAYPDTEFLATVNKLNPVVNPVTRSLKVTLSIDDDNTQLKPGMFVNMELITKEKSRALVINKEILVNRNSKKYLWILEEDSVHLREVTLGLENEKEVEILTGLKIGERVITQGFTYLEEGIKVRTLNKEKGDK